MSCPATSGFPCLLHFWRKDRETAAPEFWWNFFTDTPLSLQ